MNKTLLALSLISVTSFVFAPVALAGVSCQPIYGGGQTCVSTGNLLVDKKVLNPKTNGMVDNLSVNDPKYTPESLVTYQITVTNNGNATLNDIQVTDTLPQYVSFAAGTGNADPKNPKKVTFTVGSLNVNESKTFTLQGKVAKTEELPANQAVVCGVINQAVAVSGSQTAQDNSELCIEKQQQPATPQQPTTTKGGKQVFPPPSVQVTPPTGPEALSLLALVPSGILGFIFRKSAKIKGGAIK